MTQGIYELAIEILWGVKMVDNKSKKKLDRHFIALGQRGERNYIKRIAKEMLEKLQIDAKASKRLKVPPIIGLFNIKEKIYEQRTEKLIRICKASLKLLKVYERKK